MLIFLTTQNMADADAALSADDKMTNHDSSKLIYEWTTRKGELLLICLWPCKIYVYKMFCCITHTYLECFIDCDCLKASQPSSQWTKHFLQIFVLKVIFGRDIKIIIEDTM